MKAIRIHRYGGPEVLQLEEVPSPVCGPRDVKVRVHATSVNPVDFKIREGQQRAVVWVRRPFTPGMDVSGTVLEVGARVTRFKVGDAVISTPSHFRQGTHAEEVVVREDEVAFKPARFTHEQAAAFPLVAMTADACLSLSAKLKPGQTVLVQAGAGGVGHLAIQLAVALGASKVWATCSTRNVDFVRSLGAVPIDYTKEDYAEVARGCDVVLDALGGDDLWKAVRTVRRGGHVACITPSFPQLVKRFGPWGAMPVFGLWALGAMLGPWLTRFVTVRFVTRFAWGDRLQALADLAERGLLTPTIDRIFPLEQLADAHRYLEGGRARGKVVITTA